MQISSGSQQCMEDGLLLWQLIHNITIHFRRLSLKEGCLKIVVKNVPTFAGCQVASHPKSDSCGSRGMRLLIFLLFVLETSQYPSGLCLEEVTLFIRLDGEHPSSCHTISRLLLLHVDDQKSRGQPRICTQGVLLQQTVCCILVLLELMLPFVHGVSFWLLFLLLFRR